MTRRAAMVMPLVEDTLDTLITKKMLSPPMSSFSEAPFTQSRRRAGFVSCGDVKLFF